MSRDRKRRGNIGSKGHDGTPSIRLVVYTEYNKPHGASIPAGKGRAGFIQASRAERLRSRLCAALIRPRWVNAWG
jgi:hypothetical protein